MSYQLLALEAMCAEFETPEWESDFFETSDDMGKRFFEWLVFKGVSDNAENLVHAAEAFMNFMFFYAGGDLDCPGSIQFDDFFLDHILRKIHMEDPAMFAMRPVALKLFYDFLADIGYI